MKFAKKSQAFARKRRHDLSHFVIKNKFGDMVSINTISYDEYRKRTNHNSYWYNYTPHPINLVVSEINPKNKNDMIQVLCVIFPPYGVIARVEFGEPTVENLDGFTIHDNTPIVGVVNLPNQIPNVNLLVSALVREQIRGQSRTDIFSPDTGVTAIRTDKGKVIAVRALQRA